MLQEAWLWASLHGAVRSWRLSDDFQGPASRLDVVTRQIEACLSILLQKRVDNMLTSCAGIGKLRGLGCSIHSFLSSRSTLISAEYTGPPTKS